MRIRANFSLLVGIALTALSLCHTETSLASTISADWSHAKARLLKSGFDRKFIEAIGKAYEPGEFQNVVELNTLLFLRKSDYHGVQVTEAAVTAVESFMNDHKETLKKAQADFGPTAPVIASLLWIESRYGVNLGSFHVASVYVHLLQSDRSEVIKHLRGPGTKRFNTSPSRGDLAKIPDRARKKARWALGELRALQKIFKTRGQLALDLRGSFSGAFGIPQFLPSSYLNWARAARPGATPDLTRPDDAIRSVAYYLHKNGWRSTRPKTFMRALLNYNNSKDYANAILALAKQAEGRSLAASERAQ